MRRVPAALLAAALILAMVPAGAGARTSSPPDGASVSGDAGPDSSALTGRFLLLGVERFGGTSSMSDTSVASYLRLPDATPQGGKVAVWVLLVFPPKDGKVSSWMTEQSFDCAARTMRLVSMQVFLDDQRVGWRADGGGGWTPASSPTMNQALDLACGVARPGDPAFSSAADAVADGRSRLDK